jgi:hypothetical protein
VASHTAGAYDWLLTENRAHHGLLPLTLAAATALPLPVQFGFERKDL